MASALRPRVGWRLVAIALSLWSAAHAADGTALNHYTVSLNPNLDHLSIRACLADGVSGLRAANRQARQLLLSAKSLPSGQALPLDRSLLELASADRCISYVARLREMRPRHRRYTQLSAKSLPVPISSWLWLPNHKPAAAIEVSFDLPPGTDVSLPWTRLPDTANDPRPRFRIPDSPGSDKAMSVFGDFASCELKVAGSTLRVAALPGRQAGNPEQLFRWVAEAASNVTLTYGRFPNPAPQVIIIPVATRAGDREEPVPFGHVIRDGGEAVQFFVNQQRPLAEFIGDWTATHEFSHLMLPYIDGDENWISEGLASYFQNVLMARSGRYSANKAWRKIIQGFQRGEKAVPHLALEDAMPKGSWDGIMKTYWGGAAIFLMADVELRRISDGQASLDSVLDQLQACCLPSPTMWRGAELFTQLDSFLPAPLFTRLYLRYRRQREFPAYDGLLKRLGVRLLGKRVIFDDAAELAPIRDAIMARREPLEPPQACATDTVASETSAIVRDDARLR